MITRTQSRAAFRDIVAGVGNWRLWHMLAWQDIKQRYRRSTLGPLWLTLGMGMQMVGMGVILSYLVNASFGKLLPYVCAGLIGWSMITQMISDGAMSFLESKTMMLQMKTPLMSHIMRMMWRNVIIFGHNFLIFIVVAIIFGVAPTAVALLWPVALILDILCVLPLALLLGIISARYRDLPMIVQNIFTIAFWATPILYEPSQLGDRAYLLLFNPLTHLIELFRDPLLGQMPSILNWAVVLATTVAGWTVTFFIMARFRARVAYWL